MRKVVILRSTKKIVMKVPQLIQWSVNYMNELGESIIYVIRPWN
jgi:hypothetical protein